MTRIPLSGGKVVVHGGRVGTETDCCCQEQEPCCPCDGNLPAESCGLQSITVSVSFDELGSCFPGGVAATFSITEADNDWRGTGSWNKRHTVAAATGNVQFDAALSCEGGVGPEGQNCWALLLTVRGVGCSMCSGTTTVLSYVVRLPGITEDGVCCPVGRNVSLPVASCADVTGGTLAITCVY